MLKIDAVLNKQEKFIEARSKYLEEAGWIYSCNHPDCCWRYGKTINGKFYVMNADEAMDLQKTIDIVDSEKAGLGIE